MPQVRAKKTLAYLWGAGEWLVWRRHTLIGENCCGKAGKSTRTATEEAAASSWPPRVRESGSLKLPLKLRAFRSRTQAAHLASAKLCKEFHTHQTCWRKKNKCVWYTHWHTQRKGGKAEERKKGKMHLWHRLPVDTHICHASDLGTSPCESMTRQSFTHPSTHTQSTTLYTYQRFTTTYIERKLTRYPVCESLKSQKNAAKVQSQKMNELNGISWQ